MAQTWRMKARSPSKPLDADALNRLAVHYVGRYATTRAKLASYLRRKVKERGWDGEPGPDFDAVVQRCADSGYVNDEAFAELRSAALSRRGYGPRRIGQSLAGAGIARELAARVAPDDAANEAAAEAYARRRRIGPFATGPVDEAGERRAFAAMVRAGHEFALARRFSRRGDDSGARGD